MQSVCQEEAPTPKDLADSLLYCSGQEIRRASGAACSEIGSDWSEYHPAP
jgi:hypothetical protein